jgi:hypothetical protein
MIYAREQVLLEIKSKERLFFTTCQKRDEALVRKAMETFLASSMTPQDPAVQALSLLEKKGVLWDFSWKWEKPYVPVMFLLTPEGDYFIGECVKAILPKLREVLVINRRESLLVETIQFLQKLTEDRMLIGYVHEERGTPVLPQSLMDSLLSQALVLGTST